MKFRDNRLENCPLQSKKILEKKEREAYDSIYDQKSKITAIGWNDNSVLTIITKFGTIEPMNIQNGTAEKRRRLLFQNTIIIWVV